MIDRVLQAPLALLARTFTELVSSEAVSIVLVITVVAKRFVVRAVIAV